MHAPLFDLVNALSAEERCPVCSELHAAVDQRACADCGTAMCSDCASLRPDTAWTCAPCARQRPQRVFALASGRPALAAAYAALRVQGAGHLYELAPRARQFVYAMRALAIAFFTWASSLALRGREFVRSQLQPRVKEYAVRVEAALARHFARVATSFRRDRAELARAAKELTADVVEQARLWGARRVLAIRNVSLRDQLTAVLLGTALLIAVARSSRHSR